jgi:ribosomal protein L37AE/L43A
MRGIQTASPYSIRKDFSMANFLDYRCPKCSSSDEIEVAATIWLRLTADGTDADLADCHDHEYDTTSPAICQGCGFQGKIGEFDPQQAAPDDLLDALQQALTALNTAPRFAVPALSTNSYAIARNCEQAIKASREG